MIASLAVFSSDDSTYVPRHIQPQRYNLYRNVIAANGPWMDHLGRMPQHTALPYLTSWDQTLEPPQDYPETFSWHTQRLQGDRSRASLNGILESQDRADTLASHHYPTGQLHDGNEGYLQADTGYNPSVEWNYTEQPESGPEDLAWYNYPSQYPIRGAINGYGPAMYTNGGVYGNGHTGGANLYTNGHRTRTMHNGMHLHTGINPDVYDWEDHC